VQTKRFYSSFVLREGGEGQSKGGGGGGRRRCFCTYSFRGSGGGSGKKGVVLSSGINSLEDFPVARERGRGRGGRVSRESGKKSRISLTTTTIIIKIYEDEKRLMGGKIREGENEERNIPLPSHPESMMGKSGEKTKRKSSASPSPPSWRKIKRRQNRAPSPSPPVEAEREEKPEGNRNPSSSQKKKEKG